MPQAFFFFFLPKVHFTPSDCFCLDWIAINVESYSLESGCWWTTPELWQENRLSRGCLRWSDWKSRGFAWRWKGKKNPLDKLSFCNICGVTFSFAALLGSFLDQWQICLIVCSILLYLSTLWVFKPKVDCCSSCCWSWPEERGGGDDRSMEGDKTGLWSWFFF